MPDTKLGDFAFITMSRVPSRPRYTITREVRAGVEDGRFWKDAKRGTPFNVTTVVNVKTLAEAVKLFHDYEKAIGEKEKIEFADQTMDDLEVMIMNVDVIENGLHAMLLGIGGVEGNRYRQQGKRSYAMLRATWTLVSLVPPPPPPAP